MGLGAALPARRRVRVKGQRHVDVSAGSGVGAGAVVSSDAALGDGAVVSSDAALGDGAVVSSDAALGDGAAVSSDVEMSDGTVVSSDAALCSQASREVAGGLAGSTRSYCGDARDDVHREGVGLGEQVSVVAGVIHGEVVGKVPGSENKTDVVVSQAVVDDGVHEEGHASAEGVSAPRSDVDFGDFADAVSTLTAQAVAMTGAVTRLVGSVEARFSRLESQLDSFEGKVARAAARASDRGVGEGDASLALGGDAEAGHVDEAAPQPVNKMLPAITMSPKSEERREERQRPRSSRLT